MTDEERKAHRAIIALCKCGCGGTIYANAGDDLSEAEQRELGKMANEGYSIIHTTVGDARKREWGCQAKAKPQPGLFEEARANV